MDNKIGFKELYDVTLKATYPIEVSGRKIEKGEVVAIFDNISLAQFNEIKTFVSANGGFNNRARVFWTDTKEMKLSFNQGVFSKTQMALMSNAKLLSSSDTEPLQVQKREILESDEEGYIKLQHEPILYFVYNNETGEKLKAKWHDDMSLLKIDAPYLDVIVDYEYNYTKSCTTLVVGRTLTDGYLSFTAKTRIKDDVTGQVKTGIINIPKLKLMSDLSMVLGENAAPQTGKFDAVAIPVGNKGNQVVMEFIILDDDIDSDM